MEYPAHQLRLDDIEWTTPHFREKCFLSFKVLHVMPYIDTMKNFIIFETVQDIEPVNRDSSITWTSSCKYRSGTSGLVHFCNANLINTRFLIDLGLLWNWQNCPKRSLSKIWKAFISKSQPVGRLWFSIPQLCWRNS